jgi:hypothetical protein
MLDFLGPVPMRKQLKNGPAVSCVPGTGKCNTRGGEVKYLFVKGVRKEVLGGEGRFSRLGQITNSYLNQQVS